MPYERFMLRASPPSVSDASEATTTPSEGTTVGYTMSMASTNYEDITNAAAFRPFSLTTSAEQYRARLEAVTAKTKCLPSLQVPGADTLLFFSTSLHDRSTEKTKPFRVLSEQLLSTGSNVFQLLLAPSWQKRFKNSLVKQHKLTDGPLPNGFFFVLDLTPKEEGEEVVDWMERLWCPDEVMAWKSTLGDDEEDKTEPDFMAIIKKEEQRKQQAKDAESGTSLEQIVLENNAANEEPPKSPKKETVYYSFERHLMALQRLIYILHGIDPIIKTAPDWYTLHCVSIFYGTKSATCDYVAAWIYANYPTIVEMHPSLIWKVAIDAELSAIAADAWSVEVMSLLLQDTDSSDIPGAIEGRDAFRQRVHGSVRSLFEHDIFTWDAKISPYAEMGLGFSPGWWFEPFLPGIQYIESSPKADAYFTFVNALHSYLLELICRNSKYHDVMLNGKAKFENETCFTRSFWSGVLNVKVWDENAVEFFMSTIDASDLQRLRVLVEAWKVWEELDEDGLSEPSFDWGDVMRIKEGLTIDQLDTKTALEEGDGTDDGAMEPSEKDWDNLSVSAASTTADLRHQMDDMLRSEDPPEYTLTEVDPYQTSPTWLNESLIKLRHAYPNGDRFWGFSHRPVGTTIDVLRIRCQDCHEKLYFTGPGETADNFIRHLQLDSHRRRVASRVLEENYLAQAIYIPVFDESPKSVPAVRPSPLNCPASLSHILNLCQSHVFALASSYLELNVGFEPSIFDDTLACLEENELKFRPIWAGGEVIPSTPRTMADEDDIGDVSSAGIGSTASSEVYVSSDMGVESLSSGSTDSSFVEAAEAFAYSDEEDDVDMFEDGVEDDAEFGL